MKSFPPAVCPHCGELILWPDARNAAARAIAMMQLGVAHMETRHGDILEALRRGERELSHEKA